MSNTELAPTEVHCQPTGDQPGVELIEAREVPLGGPRAMTVRRTLPSRQRSFVGAWCFVDHYGPDDVAATGGMDVAPHPHTGLQTVTWLFSGEVEHRDSAGVHAMVRPGELNLMSAGHGICHSEVSTKATTVLHGVQLWVVLPRAARDGQRDFQHYQPEPVEMAGARISTFIGELAGHTSPVTTATALLGAELNVQPGASLDLPVNADFEHAILLDDGALELDGVEIPRGQLGSRAHGQQALHLRNHGSKPARAVLLGGEPFREEIIMWWNFIGATHEEVVQARAQWNQREERFGDVAGYQGPKSWLPAPDLPHVRLKPRPNPHYPPPAESEAQRPT